MSWVKKLFQTILEKLCQTMPEHRLTVSFTEGEASKIYGTRERLSQWHDMVYRGVLGVPSAGDLKKAIIDIIDMSDKLYMLYVPPFKVSKVVLAYQELEKIISDLKSKGGLVAWFRLDSLYTSTSLDEFKKIVSWDWTDHLRYEIDIFDCENFAFYFASRVARMFGINTVGIVLDYSSGHAYNLVVVKDDQGARWMLYEPQSDELFTYEQRNQSLYSMKQYVLLM